MKKDEKIKLWLYVGTDSEQTKSSVKHSGSSAMTWTCTLSNGTRSLVFIDDVTEKL